MKQHFPRTWLLYFIVATFSLLSLTAGAAPKTDIVTFISGDKLTGEFLSLERGRINLSTDGLGTVAIEWDKISNIISNQNIQIETINGIRYFGNLSYSGDPSTIIVVTESGPIALDSDQIAIMNPIEDAGIGALDINVSVGYNFAKAGEVKSGSFGLEMDYRSLIRIESLKFSTNTSDSAGQLSNRRSNLTLQHTRLYKDRWFGTGSIILDQNDELKLDLRTSLGVGGGRYFVQSNTMLFSLQAGAQFSREELAADDDASIDPPDQPDSTDSLEATLTTDFEWFLFDNPELDWSTTLQIIPSLTESGRVRGVLETSLSWKIIKDLKWALNFYGTFDTSPQTTGAEKKDYNVSVTLDYDFK